MCNLWCRDNRGYSILHDESSQIVEGEDSFFCYGYKRNTFKRISFHFFALALAGIPYLILLWYQQLKAYCMYSKCALSEADAVLLKDLVNDCTMVKIVTSRIPTPDGSTSTTVRYFCHHMLKYVWNESYCEFRLLKGLDDRETKLCDLLDKYEGFTVDEQTCLLEYYGLNYIAVEVKSYSKLFFDEVLNPFYIFQVLSVILWTFDDYYYYAGCVMFLCLLSVLTSLYQTRRQSIALNELVAASATHSLTILRKDGRQEEVNATHVVPGDVIVLPPHGCVMGCDAVLLTGSCIVNESMLTGESVPVTKTPPPYSNAVYDVDLHKRYTLFCGTQVLQTRFYDKELVKAVVVRIGFLTTKGELVRSILFPKPMGFKFYSDSMKFIFLLFGAAVAGMSFSVYIYMSRHADVETILLRALDIVTIVVPPALPAAMTAGTVYSQNRLSKLGIFCISPPRINVSGKVKLVSFDKTGTLTEDGLDFYALMPAENGQFTPMVKDVTKIDVKAPVVAAMASCHSLTQIDGELKGDPLDLSMFHATQWVLEEPGSDTTRYDTLSPAVVRPLAVKPLDSDDLDKLTLNGGLEEMPYEIGIVRQFPFVSSAQSMSVITRDLGIPYMRVFCKGAPEKVMNMCLEKSVPSDFHHMLTQFTSTGYRVLALAYKNLDASVTWRHAQRAKREQIELDLCFLGLLIMQNTLKPETTPVIKQLQKAHIRCLMVTGDNILTAVSVARDCGMIPLGDSVINLKVKTSEDNLVGQVEHEFLACISENGTSNDIPIVCDWHYALDGKTWGHIRHHFPELIPQVVTKGTVFARMSPDQKSQLIEALQDLDYVVAMVGDGANDCGALKTAHVGVSLSEAEASVAAPFTSRSANIKCIVHLLCEGRCALVTSFGVFKYMALYSLIQFISVIILYQNRSILGNMQFLYIDLVITTILAVVMGRTEPSLSLVVQRPLGSLLAPSNLFPLFLQLVLVVVIQLTSLLYLKIQPWYKPSIPTSKAGEMIVCWENTVVFTVSCFQYLILATVYSKGRPHRKPFYSNGLFLAALIILTIFTTLLLVFPYGPLASFFELKPLSEDSNRFRYFLILFPAVHLTLACLVEMCVAETKWLKSVFHCLLRKQKPKNRYKCVMAQMERNPDASYVLINH